MISLDDVRDLVGDMLDTAEQAAVGMFTENLKFSKGFAGSLISDLSRVKKLPVGFGVQVWATILFVDLRRSSWRADEYGPKATYLTMHAFLPTMAKMVGECGGHLVGYRGDGLFAAFGLDAEGKNPADLDHGEEVRKAVRCGKAMMEAVSEAVSPALEKRNIPGGLSIGVGIDAGNVVLTTIGLHDAYEKTAYGSPVNHASKFSGRSGDVMISNRAKAIYPSSQGGTMMFKPIADEKRALKVVFPSDYRALRQNAPAKAQPRRAQ